MKEDSQNPTNYEVINWTFTFGYDDIANNEQ